MAQSSLSLAHGKCRSTPQFPYDKLRELPKMGKGLGISIRVVFSGVSSSEVSCQSAELSGVAYHAHVGYTR